MRRPAPLGGQQEQPAWQVAAGALALLVFVIAAMLAAVMLGGAS